MYCSRCGKRLKISDKTCPKCHRPVYSAKLNNESSDTNEPEFFPPAINDAKDKPRISFESEDTSPVKLMIDVISKRVDRNDKRIKKANAQFVIMWILIILSFCFSALSLFITIRK